MVVVTGGEPLLQSTFLEPLLQVLGDAGIRVEVETAGTIIPNFGDRPNLVSQWNVSPKLTSSLNPRHLRLGEELRWFAASPRAIFKFVVTDAKALDEVDEVCYQYGIPYNRVYIMPEGTVSEIVETGLKNIAEEVIERGYNLTTRLHVSIWGNKRGV